MITLKKSRTIDRAKTEVTGFTAMFDLLEQKVVLVGLSQATLCLQNVSAYSRLVRYLSIEYSSVWSTRQVSANKKYVISASQMWKSRGTKYSAHGVQWATTRILIYYL